MLPTDFTNLESSARAVRTRMKTKRTAPFEAPPSWLRSKGPQPNARRK